MELYAHFHPDERPFVDRALDWIEQASEFHTWKTTDFLDPRQAFIVESLARRDGNVQVYLYGGYPEAERKRACIAPDYAQLTDEDLPMVVLAIESDDEKIGSLDHGDYLGALLGLGIKRDKVGDIHVRPDGCHCIISGEMASYVDLHLRQVHRVHVHTEVVSLDKLQPTQTAFEELNLSVASLRLDGIVSDVVRMSRAKILAPIKAGRCKVNWRVVEDPSFALHEGDVVSLQGFGRFKIFELQGQTKTGRIRLKIGKYV
ncbi:RNA-binding protein [Paenibacillus turpanensis]|uniref:YlmH family RNA-binding protein n=1 Tax=Paenibacillus turpanensis TaxID=2689078 RepID=UPI001408FB0F|nr:YlmH/Sll1252 family protein [Paenibacillus turpanensis]